MSNSLNLNEAAEVELTEYGKSVWRKFYERLNMPAKWWADNNNLDGPQKFHIWELMQIFGGCSNIGMGFGQVPFKGNAVRIVTPLRCESSILDEPSELEKLCETLAAEGVIVDMRRLPKAWRCTLYARDSRLYSAPTGEAETAIAAINAACDQRLCLLLQDGN